ncbi:hypothetical protein BCON_0680g00010 [Botryotinia convoluta]|uniref:J domain-containing protein n=1 Tax=Botryotinia convoluta TaxID=54673 RepID=A0A4Z1H7E0_9HELO|nr:hypothetical protein BCON_0680g00010 [Botryotinia convoluta]
MLPPPTTNHYQTLGVSGDSSNHDIERATRKLQLKIHPDKHPKDATNLKEYTKYSTNVNHARDELLDISQRHQLDHLIRLNQPLSHYSQPMGQKKTIPFTKPASWSATSTSRTAIALGSGSKAQNAGEGCGKQHQAQGEDGHGWEFGTRSNKKARSDFEGDVVNPSLDGDDVAADNH